MESYTGAEHAVLFVVTTTADLTPLDFNVWGYVKDKVFVPPLPASLEELRSRITEADVTTDVEMIHRNWDDCLQVGHLPYDTREPC